MKMKLCLKGHNEEKDRHGKCRSCTREFAREYRKTEKYKAYRKAYILSEGYKASRSRKELKDYQKAYHASSIGRKKQSDYRKSDHGKQYRLKHRLLKSYGMTIEQREEMLIKQNHACTICTNKFGRSRFTTAAVDHCHKTGKIRGLLCGKCNTALGGFKDSVELLQRAVAYLNQFSAIGA